ncbi:hypothetical protein Tco_1419919 [Tanacetum coccineum]
MLASACICAYGKFNSPKPPTSLEVRFPKAKILELKVDPEENNLQNTYLSPKLRHQIPKKANQINEPVYLASFIFHSESASRCDVLADFTTKVDPGKSAPHDSIPQQHDKTKYAGDELKTAHTNSNEPIIITDKSEEEEAKRYEDTHATSHDEPEDTSVQEKIKTLDSLPSLLNKVIDTLNRFATIMENASPKATYKSVPLAGQADASPAKGEKNINQAIKEADKANLKQQPTTTTPPTTSSFQSSFFPNPPKSTPQTKGELIQKDKGKEVIFSKDAKEE